MKFMWQENNGEIEVFSENGVGQLSWICDCGKSENPSSVLWAKQIVNALNKSQQLKKGD